MEKVEAVYKKSSLVEQIWVYGNSFESILVAVVVPNEDSTEDLGSPEWRGGKLRSRVPGVSAPHDYLSS